ncbi:MAG: polysaccharide biosynthesis protein [Roseburia sp.]|nr:polysaccharide biosynthesis protein [Roseburia sp.]
MTKTIKNSFITGTLLLTFAGVLTRLIGFFYRIFLSRTIGAEGLGIYQLLSPVMALGFAVTAAGIQTAISRFVSTEIGKKNPEGARRYFYCGLIVSLLLSALTGFIIWKYADFIASAWLGDIRCAPLLSVLSLSFVPACIHACINGYYYGTKKTGVPALCQLTEQLVRVGSVYLLYCIHMREQTPVPLSVTMWGIVLGEVASTLVSVSFAKIPRGTKRVPSIPACLHGLAVMAVPLTANRVVLNLFSGYETVMIPNRLKLFGYTSAEALGVYGILTGMAMSIIMFPSVVTNSVSVLLLPTISEAKAAGDDRLIRRTVTKTIRACLFLGFLCTAGFLFTGKYLGNLLFGNALAGTFIVTLGWICPFLYLSSTLSSVLHGLGYPGLTFCFNLAACGIRILFVLFAIPAYGIKGYLWGILLSHIATAFLTIIVLLRKI